MDYSQRLQLYHYLVSLGACDGLIQRETDVLEVIASYIGLSKAEVASIFAQFRPSNDKNYKILEIDPSASNDEVKTRKAKTGRNITKNTTVIIPEHKVPTFKPCPDFKNLVK